MTVGAFPVFWVTLGNVTIPGWFGCSYAYVEEVMTHTLAMLRTIPCAFLFVYRCQVDVYFICRYRPSVSILHRVIQDISNSACAHYASWYVIL